MTKFTVTRSTRCIGTDLYIEDLDHLKIEIDEAAYAEVKRLQGIVKQADEFAVLTVMSPGWYEPLNEDGEEADYREDGAEMTVRNKYVFFGGYEKHSDIRWECDAIDIAELDEHFNPEATA